MASFGGLRGGTSRYLFRKLRRPPPPSPPQSPPDGMDVIETGGAWAAKRDGGSEARQAPKKQLLPVFSGHPSHPKFSPSPHLYLPAGTLYALCIIGPTILPCGDDLAAPIGLRARMVHMWITFQRTYLVLLYALVLQVFIILYLSNIVFVDSTQCGAATSWYLKLACNIVYTGYILSDIFHTVHFVDWVRHAKTVPRLREIKTYENERGEMTLDEDWGLPDWYKLCVVVGLLLPKLLIACAMWVIGTGYIVLSETNSDLIVDTLAVGFVMDIDEIVYMFTTNHSVQEAIATLPPVLRRDLKTLHWMHTARVRPQDHGATPSGTPPAEGGLKSWSYSALMYTGLQQAGMFKITMLGVTTTLAWASNYVLCEKVFVIDAATPGDTGSG